MARTSSALWPGVSDATTCVANRRPSASSEAVPRGPGHPRHRHGRHGIQDRGGRIEQAHEAPPRLPTRRRAGRRATAAGRGRSRHSRGSSSGGPGRPRCCPIGRYTGRSSSRGAASGGRCARPRRRRLSREGGRRQTNAIDASFSADEQAVLGLAALPGDALQDLGAPHQPGLHVLLGEPPVAIGPRRRDIPRCSRAR